MAEIPEILPGSKTKMRKIPLLFLSIFILLFTACKSSRNHSTAASTALRPVYITNSKKINLLSPENAQVSIDEVQLLNGSFGSTDFLLMSYTQIDSAGINLALMNELGADMGNVSYDGAVVIFDSAYFPSQLPGEYIIADIQNAFYNREALKNNYEAAGLTFEEQNNSDATIRKIIDKKKVIEEITIEAKSVTINNYLRNYKYVLISE